MEKDTKNFFFLTWLVLWLGLIPMQAYTQVQVSASLDTSVIHIGDPAVLTLEVSFSPNLSVDFPVVPDSINTIEFLSKGTLDTLQSAEPPSVRYSRKMVVTGFDSGYFVIPPFVFRFGHQSNSLTDSALTEPLVLTVISPPVDTSIAIKDIKAPLEVPYTWREALPYAVGAVLFGVLAYALYRYFKSRNKKPLPEEKPKPDRPAHEIALEALNLLVAEKLWQQGRIKEYYIRLTDITRNYIDHRFAINAPEKTTFETLDALKPSTLPAEITNGLKNHLENADLVKFAKVQPLPEDHQREMDFAYLFVQTTKTEVFLQQESQNPEIQAENE